MPRVLALLVVGLLVLAGCGGPTNNEGFVTGEPGLTRVAPEDREPGPVVAGTSLEGTPLSTGDHRGKVVVVNLWGSWCAPCRKEAPDLEEAAQRTAGRAQFLGINFRDSAPGPALAFQRSFGVSYPSFYDPDGRLLLSWQGQLSPAGIPSTLVIDAEGRVAARIVGPTTATTLVGLVDDVAAGR